MATFWYILCPGTMTVNGEAVYMDAPELARNYKVPMDRCLVCRRPNGNVAAQYNHLPRLKPDPTGRWIRPGGKRKFKHHGKGTHR